MPLNPSQHRLAYPCVTIRSVHTCPSGTRPYTLQSGDTLERIANLLGVSEEAIVTVNPQVNLGGPLPIGHSICLPVCFDTYRY